MRRRAWLAGAALLAGALAPVAAPGVACAASSAALVVDTGSNVHTYCVELGGSSVNGLQLIQEAGSQHDLQYRLGHGGRAVCMLANVGASGSDCFGEYPNFWGYWRGNGSGGWTWSSTGAGNVTVSAGDVSGWSWGEGDDGSSHPAPPKTSYASICGAPVPEKAPGRDQRKKQVSGGGREDGGGSPPAPAGNEVHASEGAGSSGSSTGSTERGGRPSKEGKSAHRKERKEDQEPEPSASVVTPSPALGAAADSNPAGAAASEPGSPVGALVALVATSLFAGAGAWFVRRRSAPRD